MKKTLHNTLPIFILFVSSLLGLSNSNDQTGTLTASPETVTEFTNANGTGNNCFYMVFIRCCKSINNTSKNKRNSR